MICKHCETENPDDSVFCAYCGKRLDGKVFCPHCQALCPEDALYCNACGALIKKPEQPATENPETENAQFESAAPAAPKAKTGYFEKLKKAFDLSGGICLMTAVLFSLVFTLCMGLTASASIGSYGSASETTMIWDYFGSAYEDLADQLAALESYTAYFEASAYIPVILSTVVGAGTLISVLVFTILSAVKYGKHFKNPELNYVKPAVAAVLSFVLGSAAFLALNSTSANVISSIRISISFSDATLAGIILCSIFLGVFFAFKVVAIGKDFLQKRTIVNFVCATSAILFLVMTAAFAASPAVSLGIKEERNSVDFGLSFTSALSMLSNAFDPDVLYGEAYSNFIATYVTSALALVAQLAFLVLAFAVLIGKVAEVGKQQKSGLAVSIALFSVSAVYLVLTCLALHFGTELISSAQISLSIMAAPIVAVIFAAFTLASSITHKVLLKEPAPQE